AYLEKGKGWEAYEHILDFLNRSHIRYALTHRPTMVFDSLVKQFWATATIRTLEAGPSDIIATIDGTEVMVNESLIRTQLHLDDVNGLYEFTLHDVLDGMRAIGYPTYGSLTFYKAKLSPQWRFLIHTLIHYMSPKSGGWNQFHSSLASAVICMSTRRTYSFSRFIMDGMLGNVRSKRHKFLMYPCFLQMILGIQTTDPSPRLTFDFTAKLFSNMKLNWDGPHMPLLAPMLVVLAGGDAAGVAANEPTPVREPLPRPKQEPTPDSPRPPSLPPSSSTVGPTTSSRPPRHPSVPDDIREGGGDFVSSPQSNEAPQTPAAPAAGRAEDSAALTALSLKLERCLHRVTSLENELGIAKKVLGALHTLASATLGDDSSATAAGPDAETTMPVHNTSTTRRRLKKQFTSYISAHVSETIPVGVRVPTAASTIPVGSSVDAAVHATAASSSSIPTAADKGKAAMVDDSLPADLLSEQERVLKNLYDSQLGEELAKKIHAEQEAKFARQQEERSTFYPKPTLDAPPAKRATQGAPPIPAVSSQDPAGFLLVSIAHATVSVPAEPMVHPAEYYMDPPLTSPAHGSSEPTVDAPPPSSSRHRRKHIAKKQVTPIMDMADVAMIKFDSDSDSDDDPLPYTPYAGWEMSEEPDTFALLLWGDLHVLFKSLDDKDALHFWRTQDSWRIRSWRLYPRAQVYVLEMVDGWVIHMFVDVSYPLSVGTLERMLKHELEVSKLLVGGDLTMAEQLIGFIKAALLNANLLTGPWFLVLVFNHTTNGFQLTMVNSQERVDSP
nr:synaptobrevin, longin-like domain protein [Tanacetum cinerariifolium]